MNFTAGRHGFYEDDSRGAGMRPFSQSSSSTTSSSNSQQQIRSGIPPSLSYQYHHHQQQRRGWDETPFRGYSSGGGASQLDLMMDSSSSPTNVTINGDDAEDSEEHLLVRRGAGGGGVDSSEGVAGGGSGSTSAMAIEREHMFDKVVTPSDVGKLNRLVIPKQHAEKYFPLDSSTNEKGLLLNFEDRNGKPWRFRYSYWNSSQSYVMTKGWSRFVKEKKLDAGDIVSFQRGVGELGKDRLFIDWRRRPDAPPDHHHHHLTPPINSLSLPHHFSFHHPWNHPCYYQQQQPPQTYHHLPVNALNSSSHHHPSNSYMNYSSNVMNGNPCSGSLIYLRSAPAGPQPVGIGMMQVQRGGRDGTVGVINDEAMVFESVPVVQGKAAAKRLRLFGVNMECPISESDEECHDILSSTAVPHSTAHIQQPPSQSHFSSSSNSVTSLQLRPYSGTPVLQPMPSSDRLNKGKASMSLNFDV